MEELLAHAKSEYARTLLVPMASLERHYNGRYMAFLRDFIAECERRDPEEVQLRYELAAQTNENSRSA